MILRGQSGWGTLRELKGNPLTSSIPVLIVSVLDDRQTGLALGAAEHLVKPVSKATLLAAITKHRGQPRFEAPKAGPLKTSPKKILIADDNPASREFIRDSLGENGYLIEEACDGADALVKISRLRPDLVLMDIQMPAMDGYEVLRRIRQNSEFQGIRVIAITAFAMQGDREEALAAGFDGYVSKPVEPGSLRQQVEQELTGGKQDKSV